MMYKRFLSTFLKILELSLQIVLFLALSILLSYDSWKSDSINFYRCFLIVIPVIFAYFGRVILNSYLLSILLQIGILAAVTIYAWNNNLYMLILTTFIVVAYSIRLKFGSVRFREETIPVPMMIVMIIGYIIGKGLNSTILADSMLLLFFIFLALQVLNNGIQKLYHVVMDNRENITFQVKQITIVHIFLLIMSITLIVGGMLLFFQIPLHGVAEKMWLSLLFFLKFIMKLFIRGSSHNNTNEETDTLQETTEPDELESEEELDYSNDYSDIFNTLFVIFAIAIVIGILIAAVIFIYRYSRIFRSKNKEEQDKIEFLKPAFLHSDRTKSPVINTEESEININKKIRKIYRMKVKKVYKKQTVPSSIMPSELTKSIVTEKRNEDAHKQQKITEIYEKARYSEESVSEEQLEYLEKNINK